MNITSNQSHTNVYTIIKLPFCGPMWSGDGQWPGPGPAGSGFKYEIILRAGPGHTCCGPGLALSFNLRAGSAQLLRARAWASNLSVDRAYISGPYYLFLVSSSSSSSAFSLFGIGASSFQYPRSPVIRFFYIYWWYVRLNMKSLRWRRIAITVFTDFK